MLVTQLSDGTHPDNIGICILLRLTSNFAIRSSDNNLQYLEDFEKLDFRKNVPGSGLH